MRANRPESF